jgi:hypothetical protein
VVAVGSVDPTKYDFDCRQQAKIDKMVQKKANKNTTVMISYQSSDSIHVERINID